MTTAREKAWKKAFDAGWITPDEVRRRERPGRHEFTGPWRLIFGQWERTYEIQRLGFTDNGDLRMVRIPLMHFGPRVSS